MTVSYKLLALRLALLIKKSGKNRLTISERRLKKLAQSELLAIGYLYHLKNELEKLGHFLGNLKGGGYGLFVINSLEGATPLAINDNDFYDLNEQQLISLIANIHQQVNSQKSKDTSITKEDIGSLLWMGLSDLAKEERTVLYGDLPKELALDIHYNALTQPLVVIETFCKISNLPLLNYLVIRNGSKLPSSLEVSDENIDKHRNELNKIYQINWEAKTDEFEVYLKLNIN